MATNSGSSFQDAEDFIFNHEGGDDFDNQSNLPAVREPGREVAPARQPATPVPAPEQRPSHHEPLPYDDEDDSALVSDAISSLMRPGGRQEIAVRTPVETREVQPAPQTRQPAPQQRNDGQDAPLTAREQAFLRDLREERRQRQELQARLTPAPQPQQGPDFETRFFAEPQQVLNEIQQNFAHQLATVRLEQDLNLAEVRHGTEAFKTAYETFHAAVNEGQNEPLYRRIMGAQSPGEEIVKWHREHTLLQETGGSVDALKERLRQEILSEMQGGQRQAPQAQQPQADVPRQADGRFAPRHEVRIPTATSRLSGSQVAGNEDLEDGSDDAIFDAGRARRPR